MSAAFGSSSTRRSRPIALLTVVAVLLALLGAGAGPALSASAATTGISGVVKGQTTVGQPDAPLVSAYVELYQKASGSFVNSAYTDGNGAYAFTDIPAGTYTVHFTGVDNHADEWYNNKATQATANSITVASGSTTTASAVLSSTIGSITGTVTGTQLDGEPATPQVSAYVQLFDKTTGAFSNAAYTDGDGAYRFDFVPIGSYAVLFTGVDNHEEKWFDSKGSLADATTVAVTAGATASGISALLASTVGSISGTVFGQTTVGNPDAPQVSAYVQLFDKATGSFVNATYTDGDGAYRFDFVPVGAYVLSFDGVDNHASEWYDDKPTQTAATTVTVASAKTTSGLSTLLSSTVGSVTGTVTGTTKVGSATTPLVSAYVQLFEKASGAFSNATYTDGNGTYRFDGVPVGDYQVQFSDFDGYFGEWYSDKPTQTFAGTVTVKPGATSSAVNALLSKTANDYALTPAPVPTITGTPRFESTITAVVGTWGPGTVTTKIQWFRNGAAISGATAASYTLVAADVGASLVVKVTGSKSLFRTETKSSAAVTGLPGILTTAVPTVSGAGTVDAPLTAAPGTWGPAPVALSYQWYSAGVAVAGATTTSYTPTAGQLGAAITVKVTGTKTGYTTATTTSAPLTVAPAALSTTTPSISGLAKVAEVLTAAAGTWGPSPVALTYQWSAGGTAITGATGTTYTVAPADLGKTITVTVTGTKAGYTTATVASAPSAAVAPAALVPATPTISGTPKVGVTLTAKTGTWSPTPIAFTYQWKAGGVAVSGATKSTFSPTSTQRGKTISVTVTGTKTGYTTASSTSAATAVVAYGTFTTSAPTITGSPNVGATVTASVSGWTPTGATYGYQWSANGTAIAGATAASYTIAAADAGASLTVKVTATKTGYTTASATSSGVTVLGRALTTAVPTVSGAPVVGATLTTGAGAWGPAPVTLSYQWKANGTAISGATGTTLALAAAQLGTTITVTVTGSRSGYETESTTSAPTAAVAAGTLTGSTPTISGSATVGSTLTATAGTWGPAPVTLSYQWRAGGVAITGATSSSYTVGPEAVGTSITVTVTGRKSGYTTTSRTSAATGVVPAGTITGAQPTITGTAAVGQTLTAVPGVWSPTGVSLTYQWSAGGTAIPGATGSTYVVKAADAGKTVTVTVTGTKPGYVTLSRTSAPTATVKSGTLTAATPTISGTAKVGTTLTANPGSWGPQGVALAYQWKVGGSAVSGATATTFTPRPADVGSSISVTVTGSLTGYTTASRTSAATASVVAGTISPGTLSLAGTTRVGQTLTAHIGTWGPAPVTTNIQWYRNGGVIVGATGPTRVLVPADLGGVITFKVGGKKDGYTSVTVTSPSSAAVAKGILTGPIPSMSGTLKVGSTLTANLNGAWGPAPVALEYRWTADAVAIPGANGPTFKLTSAQAGKKIIIKIIGTKAAYEDLGRQSPYSVPVAK